MVPLTSFSTSFKQNTTIIRKWQKPQNNSNRRCPNAVRCLPRNYTTTEPRGVYPASVTDQILIKAKRIRSLEVKGVSMVGEGIYPEFQAIVNYGIIGLIQLANGYADTVDMTADEAMNQYDNYAQQALDLMIKKNHDYDEAWRSMRVSSYTDLILQKINRTKEIEGHDGKTLVSEGIDANYLDMINYSVFGLIKLDEG